MKMISILLSLTVLTACGLPRKTATYDIKQPTNEKHHAIIKIYGDKGGTCSAFVISDKVALTSGHCIVVDEYNKKMAILETKKQIDFIKKKIEEIKFKKMNNYQLMRLVTQLRQLEYSLKLVNTKQFKTDTFKVKTINGVDTEITATAAFKPTPNKNGELIRDYGIIKGDFSNFNKLKVKRKFDVKSMDILRSCGYPGNSVNPVCIDFMAVNQMGFSYAGRSMIVPGMSGGPVIDADGYVVGINESVYRTFSLFCPTMGILK